MDCAAPRCRGFGMEVDAVVANRHFMVDSGGQMGFEGLGR